MLSFVMLSLGIVGLADSIYKKFRSRQRIRV